MKDRLPPAIVALFASIMFGLFILSAYYSGYNNGLKESKKMISPSVDAKEVVYTTPPIKPEPDVLPWKNRWKQIKHMNVGESTYIKGIL